MSEDKISAIATETMFYHLSSPLPMPPGYEIEPFLVMGILLVERPVDPEDPDSETISEYIVLAVPDWNETKRTLPEKCPEEQKARDPNWEGNWPLAVTYNRGAQEHESHGRRKIVTVPADIVVRVERVVDDNEFRSIINDLTRQATQTQEPPAPQATEPVVEPAQPVVEPAAQPTAVQPAETPPQVVQPDGGGSVDAG
jgi:hypothetical protein